MKDKLPTCSSSQKLLTHSSSSSSSLASCLFLLSPAAACLFFLRRSPKRIADEAELVSGFCSSSSPLPTFAVGADALALVDGDVDGDDPVTKEMSGFSVEAEGCLVEEKEWAKDSGWRLLPRGRDSFSAFGH